MNRKEVAPFQEWELFFFGNSFFGNGFYPEVERLGIVSFWGFGVGV